MQSMWILVVEDEPAMGEVLRISWSPRGDLIATSSQVAIQS